MNYELTIGEVTLSLRPVPTVFIKTPHMPGIHSYLASQFLDASAKGDGFVICGSFPDEDDVPIRASEVSQFALWLREKCTAIDGQFKTLWIPSDPKVPF
jgi:hypothetical protein